MIPKSFVYSLNASLSFSLCHSLFVLVSTSWPRLIPAPCPAHLRIITHLLLMNDRYHFLAVTVGHSLLDCWPASLVKPRPLGYFILLMFLATYRFPRCSILGVLWESIQMFPKWFWCVDRPFLPFLRPPPVRCTFLWVLCLVLMNINKPVELFEKFCFWA